MQTAVDWQNIYPNGMEKIVNYMKERYNNIPMFITENGKKFVVFMHTKSLCLSSDLSGLVGYGEISTPNSTTEELLHDIKRIEYMAGYLEALLKAVR